MDNKTTHILFIALPFVLLILIGALVVIQKTMPKQYQWINFPLGLILLCTIGYYVYLAIIGGGMEETNNN